MGDTAGSGDCATDETQFGIKLDALLPTASTETPTAETDSHESRIIQVDRVQMQNGILRFQDQTVAIGQGQRTETMCALIQVKNNMTFPATKPSQNTVLLAFQHKSHDKIHHEKVKDTHSKLVTKHTQSSREGQDDFESAHLPCLNCTKENKTIQECIQSAGHKTRVVKIIVASHSRTSGGACESPPKTAQGDDGNGVKRVKGKFGLAPSSAQYVGCREVGGESFRMWQQACQQLKAYLEATGFVSKISFKESWNPPPGLKNWYYDQRKRYQRKHLSHERVEILEVKNPEPQISFMQHNQGPRFGCAASGGALAPQPPRGTGVGPEPPLVFIWVLFNLYCVSRVFFWVFFPFL